MLHGFVEFVNSDLTSISLPTNSSSFVPTVRMSNPELPIPVTTGTKRKAEPTYDELKEEVKRVRASLKESRVQYNSVVTKYNILCRRHEKQKQDYSELAEKHQGAILDLNTLRSINFFSD